MRRPLTLLVVIALAIVVSASALGSPKTGLVHVHANLRGASDARGSFSAAFPRSGARPRFLWTLLFFDLTGPVVKADLELGRGVLFTLCRPCKAGQSGSTKLTQRGRRLIESGGTSVNVRTTKNPGGELRGRLLVSR